jgi:hypothetical protein
LPGLSQLEAIMPHYYFDVRNGRRHADSLGLDCNDDKGAIAKAKFIATQIAIDTPPARPVPRGGSKRRRP